MNKWDTGMPLSVAIAATRRYSSSPEEVVLDFSTCLFLSAEAAALLTALVLERTRRRLPTSLDPATLIPEVRRQLQRLGFFGVCGLPERGSAPGTCLPLLVARSLDKDYILEYIDRDIMGRRQMPQMSPALAKEIRRAFFEVVGNVFFHSGSPIGAIACGQIYPKADEIQITFLDSGVGVAAKVRAFQENIDDDGQAINWAVQRGTSTLSSGSQSRGLGLYLLRDFIHANEGEFRMYANGAYLEDANGRTTLGVMASPLRGTLIDLRIKIRPDVRYSFSDELVEFF